MIATIVIYESRKIAKDVRDFKVEHKIQDGRITYSDLNTPAKALFSKRFRLSGKPDYIVKKNNHYIPVEVKTGEHHRIQKNHVFQLAAYCQLLEDNYGGFVPYGILVYNTDQQYKIPFDPKLRFELESSIKEMRRLLKTKNIQRNHADPYRCRSCSMRSYCGVKLM